MIKRREFLRFLPPLLVASEYVYASGQDGPTGVKEKWLPILKQIHEEKCRKLREISPAFGKREAAFQSDLLGQDSEGHLFFYSEASPQRGARVSLSGKLAVTVDIATGELRQLRDRTAEEAAAQRGRARIKKDCTWTTSRVISHGLELLRHLFYSPPANHQMNSALSEEGGTEWVLSWNRRMGAGMADIGDSSLATGFGISFDEELGFKSAAWVGDMLEPPSIKVGVTQAEAIRLSTSRVEHIRSGTDFQAFYSANYSIAAVIDAVLTAVPPRPRAFRNILTGHNPNTRLCWRISFKLLGNPSERHAAAYAPLFIYVDAETGEIIRDHY